MIGKNKIKLINSLKLKKYRQKYGLFTAEGLKTCEDFFFGGFNAKITAYTNDAEHTNLPLGKSEQFEISSVEMKKISQFKTPSDLLAVFEIPPEAELPGDLSDELMLYCDGIQDPGNLGTMLRTAAWFGIRQVICSPDTADMYNPKTIQASMGAVAKIKCRYLDEKQFFDSNLLLPENIFAADMDGENIYSAKLPPAAVIIMGNEGQGIRPAAAKYISKRIHIPSFASPESRPESLNVAAATAVIFSEFKRQSEFLD